MVNLKQLLGDAYKDGMTFDEIQTALEKVELPADEATSQELAKTKKALEKSNSEAAGYKKKYQEKLSEEEKAAEERAAADKAVQEELATLRKEKAISEHKSKLMAAGYSEELATSSAKALVEGDTKTFYADQAKHLKQMRESITAELLKGTPTPPGGNPGSEMTREQYRKLSLAEKQKMATENPTLYAKMNNSEE